MHDSRTICNQLDEYVLMLLYTFIHTHAKAPKYNCRHFPGNCIKITAIHTISHPVLRDWCICKYFTEMTETHNRTCDMLIRHWDSGSQWIWNVFSLLQIHTAIPWLHYACICFLYAINMLQGWIGDDKWKSTPVKWK